MRVSTGSVLAMPGGVDPTGLVKGWAVARALDVLRLGGVTGALVNGGGEVAFFGSAAPGRAQRAVRACPVVALRLSGPSATST